jgi:dTMP kinase
MSGIFISFEGIDGAGKSTHIAPLAQAFTEQGRMVTLTREPGGTPLAEKLRAMVLNDPMDPMTEALLVFAARRDHLHQVIEPALARGDVVLCDRFTDATFAYQGAGRDFDLELLSTLEQWVQSIQGLKPDLTAHEKAGQGMQGIRQPDLTLWFDLDPAIAAERLAGARAPDRFEAQSLAFFQRVVAGYARRMQQSPQRFAQIAANAPVQAVWQAVRGAVVQRGWLT